jgi:hypothetical protein
VDQQNLQQLLNHQMLIPKQRLRRSLRVNHHQSHHHHHQRAVVPMIIVVNNVKHNVNPSNDELIDNVKHVNVRLRNHNMTMMVMRRVLMWKNLLILMTVMTWITMMIMTMRIWTMKITSNCCLHFI